MLYALKATPVSRYFTLEQALRWVAYREYPTSWWFLEDYHGIEEIFEQSSNAFPKEPFFPDDDLENIRLNKLDLSYPQDDEYNYDYRDLEAGKISGNEAGEQADALLRQYSARVKYIDQCCFDPYRSQLFLKLHNSDITVYGQLRGTLRKGVDSDSWKNEINWGLRDKIEATWDIIEYNDTDTFSETDVEEVITGKVIKGFQQISPEFWNSTGIDWDYSQARSQLGWYHLIFIPAESLYAHFPHPEGKPIGVENRAGHLMYDDKGIGNDSVQHSKSRRGRPSYPWPEFHAEIGQYIAYYGSLPDKQTAFEYHMREWCREHWGTAPGHATLHEQISPHYARKKKVTKSA